MFWDCHVDLDEQASVSHTDAGEPHPPAQTWNKAPRIHWGLPVSDQDSLSKNYSVKYVYSHWGFSSKISPPVCNLLLRPCWKLMQWIKKAGSHFHDTLANFASLPSPSFSLSLSVLMLDALLAAAEPEPALSDLSKHEWQRSSCAASKQPLHPHQY